MFWCFFYALLLGYLGISRDISGYCGKVREGHFQSQSPLKNYTDLCNVERQKELFDIAGTKDPPVGWRLIHKHSIHIFF